MLCWGKRYLLFGVGLFFSSVVPASSDIVDPIWESPVNNQEISGLQAFRGHVYSSTSKKVSVTLLIAGATVEIPWGAARGDVATTDPGLHSGFGSVENVGNLVPGPVSITIEFREEGSAGTCTAPTCVSQTRDFFVVKPGAREGEVAPFRFVNDLDPTGATAVFDGDDLILGPVTVQDSGNAGSRKATIRLRWLRNSQSFATVASASGTSFAAVQTIFTARCAVGGCHVGGGVALPGSLDLSAGNAYRSLIGIKSEQDSSRLRVSPGDDGDSYLYQKVREGGAIVSGSQRMPFGCTSNATCLTSSEIDAIETWINDGAPPPQ